MFSNFKMPQIHPDYRGKKHLAIVHNGARYVFIDATNRIKLAKSLSGLERVYAVSYEEVNQKAFGIVTETVEKLNRGQIINLETILAKPIN